MSKKKRTVVRVIQSHQSITMMILQTLLVLIFASNALAFNLRKSDLASYNAEGETATQNVAGDYVLRSLTQDEEAIYLPANYTMTLTQQEGEGAYTMGMTIGNILRTALTITDDTMTFSDLWATTRMMPPPDVYAVEQAIFTVLSGTMQYTLNEGILDLDGERGNATFEQV
jgi:heat shock protein HslJ